MLQTCKMDMTKESNYSLIMYCKKVSYNAGWDPQILGKSDAERPPEYKALVNLIINPKFIGGYNMSCISIG